MIQSPGKGSLVGYRGEYAADFSVRQTPGRTTSFMAKLRSGAGIAPSPGSPFPPARIEALLRPFLPQPLSNSQITALAAYLDLLLRWNAGLNLTAVREPNNIVTRHIGESLFAAIHLLTGNEPAGRAIDFGSGAGFPGLPLKIYAPHLPWTLIESQHKKATFLREVVRTLQLAEVDVFAGRGEDFRGRGQLVVLRAVERFEQILPIAASLLDSGPAFHSSAKSPRLGLLIGAAQAERARAILPRFHWEDPIAIPLSASRIILIGTPERSGVPAIETIG